MEIAVVTIAVWLILVGLYGAWPLLRRGVEDATDSADGAEYTRPARQAATPSFLPERPEPQGYLSSTTTTPVLPLARAASEIEQLRAQVQQLRSEITTLSDRRRDVGQKRARSRRTVAPANLQRPIRRQLTVVRTTRQSL